MPTPTSVNRAHRRTNRRVSEQLAENGQRDDGWGSFSDAFAGTFNPEGSVDPETRALMDSFPLFLQQALPLIVPGGHINWGWHLDAMAEHLQAVSRRQIKNLLMVLPPRCLKSSTLVCWSAWEWTWDPTIRRLCTSYDKELAMRDNGAVRDLIASDWYQDRWGDRIMIRPDIDAKSLFQNTAGGRRLVSSIGSRGTGEGGTRVEVDDPHNVLKAEAEADRQRAIDWWLGTMSTRVNDAYSAKIVTGQRVHHRDLIGTLIGQMVEADGEFYERLILPMEYDPKLIVSGTDLRSHLAHDDEQLFARSDVPVPARSSHGYYQKDLVEVLSLGTEEPEGFEGATDVRGLDPEDRPSASIPFRTTIGFVDPRHQVGELLCPEQWPESEIRVRRITLGPYRYAAQYQGSPTPSAGGQFKEHYWGRFDVQQLWHRGLRASIIVVDSAYGEEGGDPTGVAVWGELGGRLYVLEAIELEEETPQLRAALRDLHAKWQCPFLIENKANGKALIQDLRHGSDGGLLPSLPCIPFEPDGLSKEARAFSVVTYIAGGLVFVPHEASWVASYIQQHKEFPKGIHDDLVDTTAMAIHWLKLHTSSIRDLFNAPTVAPYGARMRIAQAPGARDGRWLH